MGEVKWTKEQSQAINEDKNNILVAAAAGSGKTAVLVERIISKIINKKVDIDKILVVTFTNAAASEMRARILDAIYKKLDENSEDEHLQRQITLLAKANICTIHSFCLDVIKNNFYEIDATPNARIADEAELKLLKQEVLEDIFEKKYIEKNEKFIKLINTYTDYRDDEKLKEIVLSIYNFVQSTPFPKEWLNEKIEMFNFENKLEQDFSQTIWGNLLLNMFNEEAKDSIVGLKQILKKVDRDDELEKFAKTLRSDIEGLQWISEKNSSWDDYYKKVNLFSFDRWPTDKKVISDLKDEAKEKRNKIKDNYNKLKNKIFTCSSEEANKDLFEMYEILKLLKNLIFEFMDAFAMAKKERNLIDFGDFEHFALNILIKKDEFGNNVESEIAKKYKEKFDEIDIDEYQDSNLVQESILTAISKGNNIFMVGDVKQSIYKFRQARPDLFLDKYEKYKNGIDGVRIQLFKNFRSRLNVLNITNLIFKNIMSKEFGDIDYNEEEYLNLGADYNEEQIKTEVHVLNMKQKEKTEENEEIGENEEEEKEQLEKAVVEAKFVAKKINEIVKKETMVYDKKQGYRRATYKDIVVLLRTTKEIATLYENEIAELNIPVFSDTSQEYLESVEIQTIMSVLKIIDNPMQDIPLVSVLRSVIGGFSDNDLIEIRLDRFKMSFYESMLKYNGKKELEIKIENFLNRLKKWKEQEEYLALDELIWQIYIDTGYYNYVSLMSNGLIRQANLKMLFERAKQYENASFKGLYNFINFVDKLKSNSGDLSAAKLIGENENVVRIMSIHKSKGLEFPIVFLSGTSKSFNMQEFKANILLHQDIGIGPQYVNYERRIEYSTLPKETIKYKAQVENMAEEMRILYVALTRAKEKLIITGTEKDAEKSLKEKSEFLELYDCKEKIDKSIVKKYKTYLDWIELVYLNNKESTEEILEFYVHENNEKDDEINEVEEKKDVITEIEKAEVNEEKIKHIKDLLNWQYKYKYAEILPTKTSVTKIKELKNQIKSETRIVDKPKFLKNTSKLSGAEKGTVIHLCLQKLNPNVKYTLELMKKFVEELIKNKFITELEASEIEINKLYSFTNSKLWQDVKMAKKVYKEQPFYINLVAKDIYEEAEQEKILVQGIIDLYYITQQDEIVLVDYKTDFVEQEDELINKYEEQLKLYKNALEKALNKNVGKVYIYSVYLEKEIELKVDRN